MSGPLSPRDVAATALNEMNANLSGMPVDINIHVGVVQANALLHIGDAIEHLAQAVMIIARKP